MTTTDDVTLIESEPESVYVLMGRVLRDLPAIGKNQVNTEQRFNFRGYDDVLNGLNPILSRHGIFLVPDVIERVVDRRSTRGGSTMYEVNLHVRYRFYGPGGDYVEASGWGEGTDMGDKATNKAMTNALKYVLFQTFAISTEETYQIDSDRHTPEESVPDVAECRYCPTKVKGARTEREPMRVHMIEAHGWVRQDDGTVLTPEMHAKKVESMQDEAAALGEDNQDTGDEAQAGPVPVVTPAPERPVKAAPVAPAPEPAPEPPAAPEPPVSDAPVPDDAPADPVSEPEPDPAPSVTDAEPDPDGGQDDEGVECPEEGCTEPAFATQDEYVAHWYATHDPDNGQAADEEPTSADTTEDPAALVAEVQKRITSLAGADARAYGKYRKDKALPRPADLSADQARDLLSFLDALAAK